MMEQFNHRIHIFEEWRVSDKNKCEREGDIVLCHASFSTIKILPSGGGDFQIILHIYRF